MVIIFILVLAVIACGVWGFTDGSDYGLGNGVAGAFFGLFLSFVVSVGIVSILSVIGQSFNTTKTAAHYSQKIISIQDGSQVQGGLVGGLFLVRGQIGEKQYFSYYRQTGDNTFNLDKREADASNIITDATAETARVDITDEITTCKSSWWFICSEKPSAIFVHADFHVPANSIKNDFVLDAQS